MNLKEIKEMINLMNENGLAELEIEKDGMRIKLKKEGETGISQLAPLIIEKGKITHDKEETQTPETTNEKIQEIKAPMVGTFYRSPSPEAPSFLEVGQIIEVGQVVCIIEAMKLMNEIKSEIKGKVLEVLVENAEPVEFGQIMFLVEAL